MKKQVPAKQVNPQVQVMLDRVKVFLNSNPETTGGFPYTIDTIAYDGQGMPLQFIGTITAPVKDATPEKTAMVWNINGTPLGTQDIRATLVIKQAAKDFLK